MSSFLRIIEHLDSIKKKCYIALCKIPYMTCSLIILWCSLQKTRKPLFPKHEDDIFCFSSTTPFKTTFMYAFSHSDMLHITFNSIGMLIAGGSLEYVEGPITVLFIFASSVTMGACYFALWKPDILVRGASGGCYGIMAAQLSNVLLNWSEMPFRWCRLILCMSVICAELVAKYYYRNSTIGYAVHFGGALGGFTTAIIYTRNMKVRSYELIFVFIGICIYFGSVLHVLHMGYWKPSVASCITGFPLIIQTIMTIKLYCIGVTQFENGDNIFKLTYWRKLCRSRSVSVLPEFFT